MSRIKAICFLLALGALPAAAETVAITGGRVVTGGSAGTIENGTVLIQDGKVRAVGRDVSIPSGARRIDATGKTVTTGFMDSLARLGLVEVGAVEGTVDTRTERDEITAAFNVADAIKWITINPAKSMGIGDQTGSLEVGKMADVVVWSGDPFSVYSRAEKVYIDGALAYDRNDPAKRPRTDFELGLVELEEKGGDR